MPCFQKINNLTGWIVFAVATTVYALTVEPTASFWDSGEFIATSYTLGITHPPGAPLYMLIGRLFSFFSFGDVQQVAYWINMVSVLCSGFTILFMFWSITLLGSKMMGVSPKTATSNQVMALMASGVIGSLAFTFSDSFWFSAVEAEVYAMSSMFTAMVVWAMLKWELMENERAAHRWLIGIAYLMGLSVGVHLLNLLAIPALVLLFYFKKYRKTTAKGILLTLLISGGLLLVILHGLGISLELAAGLDIFLVNNLGLPFGSGLVVLALVILSLLVYGIFYSIRKQKILLNMALLGAAFIMIGYSSYTVIMVRAKADPPINLNRPDDVLRLVSFLNREQYPTRPLFRGPYFDAELKAQVLGKTVYKQGEEKYAIKDHTIEQIYNPKETTIFPRMYSNDASHAALYRQITGLREGEKPTFADNLEFFFKHQVGHMFLRYFMWNFSGRASDKQGADWLSPVDFFSKVPAVMAENKARNNYLMLPLLLGLLGLMYQYRKNKRGFSFVMLLFFMTGFALVLYTNNPPIEPRERDYAYVGAFFAFSIWIGLGAIAAIEALGTLLKQKRSWVTGLGAAACLSVPVLMAMQNWDDHDRSDRYFSVDAARNTLASCDENAILFTGGDNDTYPLWYVQNVEGFRTDVRVLVTSFSNGDWYIAQMKKKEYDSEALPLSLSDKNYEQGGLNDYIPYVENPNVKGAINASQYLKLIKNENPALQIQTVLGNINTVPANQMYMNINVDQLLEKGILPESKAELATSRMQWKMKGRYLTKGDLVLMDLIDSGNWERPVYLNNTSLNTINIDLNSYVIQEGDTFKLLPLENPNPDSPLVDTDKMYNRMMNQFAWRELDNPDSYYSDQYRSFVQNQRTNFNILAEELINEGKTEQARNSLTKSLEVMPDQSIRYDVASVQSVGLLLALGETGKAGEIAAIMAERADELLGYLAAHYEPAYERERNVSLFALNRFATFFKESGMMKDSIKYENLFTKYYESFNRQS